MSLQNLSELLVFEELCIYFKCFKNNKINSKKNFPEIIIIVAELKNKNLKSVCYAIVGLKLLKFAY